MNEIRLTAMVIVLSMACVLVCQGISLYEAICTGNEEVVREHIEQGARVNVTYENSRSALHVAAACGHTNVVKLLLDHGAEVNKATKKGITSLMEAALKGHMETCRLLLSQGAHIDPKSNEEETVLHGAVKNGHDDIVSLLLGHGVNPNVTDKGGIAPLHLASGKGYTNIMIMLCDRGADIDIKNRNGFTPLHAAVYGNQLEAVKLLLHRGVDIEAKDQLGDAALDVARKKQRFFILKELVNYDQNFIALRNAVIAGDIDAVKSNSRLSSKVNMMDEFGWTVLHWAANEGHSDIVEFLLSQGANQEILAGNLSITAITSDDDVRVMVSKKKRARRGWLSYLGLR